MPAAAFRISWRETLIVAWSGLRGAVPIILATYPLLAGIPEAKTIFNLVFGRADIGAFPRASIAWVARLLGVNAPAQAHLPIPDRIQPDPQVLKNELTEVHVPAGLDVVGRSLPRTANFRLNALVVLIRRDETWSCPEDGTRIEARRHATVY